MFWNDPNLYSVQFKDIPHIPLPFYGMFPRYFTPFTPYDVKPNLFTPPMAPPYFTPQMTPFLHTPPVTPNYFTPQINPLLHTPPVTPNYFTPQINPLLHTPPVTPNYFTPQITPFLQNPIHRFMDPMVPQLPFNYTLPFFQGYRPFGL